MAELDLQITPQLAAHLNSRRADISDSLHLCFDQTLQLQAGMATPWLAVADTVTGTAGVACIFQTTAANAVLLIPESLELPDWFRSPDDIQRLRLDALAAELGACLFPEDVVITATTAHTTDDLALLVRDCQAVGEAMAFRLPVRDGDQQELGDLLLVWPLQSLPAETRDKTPASVGQPPMFAEDTDAGNSGFGTFEATATEPVIETGGTRLAPRDSDPLARLRKLPVTISVRLTERRINMSQLLAITPGALLTFNKSCDDLLDLYVNNSLYCRGEAVKIGESFGLKINEIGVKVERPGKIIDG